MVLKAETTGWFRRRNPLEPCSALGTRSNVPLPMWKQRGISRASASLYIGKKYSLSGHLPASLSPFLRIPTQPWSLDQRSSWMVSSIEESKGGRQTQRRRPPDSSQRFPSQRL